jgi:hypothetical protein
MGLLEEAGQDQQRRGDENLCVKTHKDKSKMEPETKTVISASNPLIPCFPYPSI